MSPRLYFEIALIAIAAAASWGYVHKRDEALKAEGQLAVFRAQHDSAKAESDRLVAAADSSAVRSARARAASDARAAEAERRVALEAQARAAAERRAADAMARAPAKADTIVLVSATGDTAAVRRRVNELLAVQAEERRGWQDVIRSDSVVIGELRAEGASRLVALDSAMAHEARREAEVAALTKRAETAERTTEAAIAARPGWLARNVPKAAVAVAFVVGWILRDHLSP